MIYNTRHDKWLTQADAVLALLVPTSKEPERCSHGSTIEQLCQQVTAAVTSGIEQPYFCVICGERFASLGDAHAPHSAARFTHTPVPTSKENGE